MVLFGNALTEPSKNVQLFRLTGVDPRLKISTNSASGKPTTGVGSANISEMMIWAFEEWNRKTKTNKNKVRME